MFDFKGLIDALMRRAREEEGQGPSATQLLIDLPRNESLAVLTEIIKALAALNRNPRIGLKERYRAVQGFDDKARPLAAILIRVFRGEEQVEGLSARQVLPSVLACWRELASAYKLCLKQHAQAPSPRFANDAELITLRAINYYAEQAKWAYLRYFEAEPRLWRSLNRLYQIAEAAGFAQKTIPPYMGQPATSVSQLYRHALLLKLAEPERRRIEDIWLIDRQLRDWVAQVSLEKVIRPRDQVFAVNLDEPKPPTKLRRNMVGERYRYLDTEPLSASLNELSHAAARGSLPASFDPCCNQQEQDNLARLLQDLAMVYSRTGQARSRRNERRHREKTAATAIGLARIARALAGSEKDWEPWNMADESASGLGAHYKAQFDDKLAIGELLAFREDSHIQLAVVRRLHKSREGQVKVGAERLATQPVAVSLQDGELAVAALYCADSPHGRMLLLPAEDYETGREYLLIAGPKRFSITLGPLLEALPEYVVSGFSVHGKH
ncbi:hypothetical protein [Chitinimonas sp.]|uniref:hypothetical protein n=1 Tax=Chitinimonas sp. TaxID=1934313 RepID=UPI002F955076